MIALAVAAIISAIALPSYHLLLEKRQVTSGAEQLESFLSSIQIQSVMRDESIAVSYTRTNASKWCLGAVSGTTPCDCMVTDTTDASACMVGDQLMVFSNDKLQHPGILNSISGDGAFVFDPTRGLMVDHTDATTLYLSSEDGTYALAVEINPAGQLKICSSNSAKQTPGFEACQ